MTILSRLRRRPIIGLEQLVVARAVCTPIAIASSVRTYRKIVRPDGEISLKPKTKRSTKKIVPSGAERVDYEDALQMHKERLQKLAITIPKAQMSPGKHKHGLDWSGGTTIDLS
jgi:hypothetical protein